MGATEATTDREVALISVSMDLGSGRRGVDMGPSAMRIAGLTEQLRHLGYRVRELGSVHAADPESAEVGDGTARYLDEIVQVCGKTQGLVRLGLDQGCMPIMLGGDHSISLGTASAVARHYREQGSSIGIIWVDAHTDMNIPESSPSGNVHGMPLAVLTGHGPKALLDLVGPGRAVDPKHVSVVGAREIDGREKNVVRDAGIRVFTMSELDERGVAVCVDEAIERASTGTSGFHLSYDLDSLDPMVAPGVGTPVPGGLTYREAHLICEKVARSGKLLSLEVVELNPVLDLGNQTARLAVGLVASALGKTIL